MTVVVKNTENLSGTTEEFFHTPGGLETEMLQNPPDELPIPGFVKFYLKNGGLFYLDELGVETNVLTESTIAYGIHEFDFTYDMASPSTLMAVTTDQRIMRVGIIIVTPFDDPAATVSIGHTGNQNGLMASADNDPSFAAYYEVESNMKYGGVDVIKLYVDPGNSSQGSGTLFLETNIM